MVIGNLLRSIIYSLKAYLKSLNCTDAKINQMANYALIDWKDNMDILDDAPSVYYPIICAGMSDEQIRVMEEEKRWALRLENMSYGCLRFKGKPK